MEQLKWILELIDKCSSPANKIQASLKGVTSAATRLKQSTQHTQDFSASMNKATESSSGLWSSMAMGNIASGMVSSLASAAANGAVELGRATLGAVAFKENALIGLEVLLKSQTAAAAVYKEAEHFAAVTPFDTKNVIELYQGLITAGFSIAKDAKGISEVNRLATTIGDVAAAHGMSPESITELTQIVAKIKNNDKITAREMMQLSIQGVSRTALMAEMAAGMGKKVSQIPGLITKGAVKGDDAINAIVAAVSKTYGGMMDKQSTTLTGLWSTLSSRPFEIMSSLDISDFSDLKDFIQTIAAMFDPSAPAATAMKGFLDNTIKGFFDAVLGWAKDAQGKISPEKIMGAFHKIADVFSYLRKTLQPLSTAIINLATILIEAWKPTEDGSTKMSALATVIDSVVFSLAKFIRVVQFLVSFQMAVGRFAGWVIDGLLEMLGAINDAYEWFKDAAYNLGVAIWQGMIEGVKSAGSAVIDAVKSLGSDAYEGSQADLIIQSPSKKFAYIGRNIALGMAQGINASAGAVDDAARALATPPDYSRAGASLASGAQGNSTQGNSAGSPKFEITINANGQGEDQVKAIKAGVLKAMSDAFEQMGWEMGIAPQ